MVDAAIDPSVVASFAAGDSDAVRTLYRTYAGLVMSVAMRVLGDRGHAEEAVQQTFVQAWRHGSDLDPGRDPAPWLVTIARRAAIDIQRREGRRPASALDDADQSDSALIALPPSEERTWEAAQVRRAVDALSPDERAIVQLQHVQGYTHQQIADQLAVPVGTVKSRSFRAHRSLAAALAHLREEAS
jgi:RNA polymerase sigma-70 factor (ECF subfamily)